MEKRLTVILAALFLTLGAAFAQNKITGTVISQDDGEPVIGATVKIQGTNQGTATNYDGKFTISVPAGKKIVVTYVGMITQTVTPKNGMKITLHPDARTVDEIVVTGMQKQDKRMFTGATTKIDASTAKLDGVADVTRSLQGRVAGVSMQNVSGTFGTAPKIRVRGATSIYGNSKPLWVIDGVIQEEAVDVSADDLSSGDAVTLLSNAISGLSADDIESFQVLKDGSATSIYGARAMAGVIVITTKRAKAGHSSINYTGEFTYRLKPNYRDYNICNSQEQMGIYKEMAAKGWLEYSSLANGSSAGVYGKMYNLMSKYDPTTGFGLPQTQAAQNAYLQQAEFRNTDWFDLLFNDNVMQNHSVSVQSGTDKASLYASMSAINDPGWYKDSKVERYTANMNASYKLSKWLTATILTNGSFRKQKAPGTLAQTTNVVDGSVNRNFDINPYSYALNTSRTLDPAQVYTRNYAPFNIFDELEQNYQDITEHQMKFQGELTWKPIQGLEFHVLGAYRTNKSTIEHFILNRSNMAEAYRAGVDNPNIMYNNTYLYTDPDKKNALPECVMPVGGIYIRTDRRSEYLDFRGTVQYIKDFMDGKHIVNFFGGMEANKADASMVDGTVYGRDYDNNDVVTITPALYKQAQEEGTEFNSFGFSYSRNLAYFANASYSYKGRYSINGTVRYEGSNRLGKTRKARWLPTWNISGLWNAYEESFFKKWMEKTNEAVSHLAFRVSYSLTAERGPSSITNARPIFVSENIWRPQGDQIEQAIILSQNANSELTYEKKHELNLGLDLGLLKNRINLNFDIYWRNLYDLIGLTQTEGISGENNKWANVATMKSHGCEFTLSTRNIQQKAFQWTSDLTFSYAKDEITELNSRPMVNELITGNSSGHYRQGYPVSALFSIPFMGLNDEGLPTIMNELGEVTTSDINFQEYEKLDFLKYEGPTEPTFTGGLNNMLCYKNWRLNVFVTYAFGNKIRLDPVFAAAYSDMDAMPKEFKNRWVIPGHENMTDVPAIASVRQTQNDKYLSRAYNAYNYSTARVADGGFIRLKDVSLTYDLPKQFLAKIGLANASLKLDATNLCLLYADSKLNGQDPELVNSGGVASPMPKQFTFTLRLGL